MDAPADREWLRLDPRVIDLDRTVGLVVAVVLSFVAFVGLVSVWLIPDAPFWLKAVAGPAWPPLVLGLAALAYWWPPVDYRRSAYRIGADGIEIRRGVVWRTVISVPRSRVQHIDVSQGPLERRYGLGTLSVYTAGTAYSRVDLRGVDHPTALALRDRLLPAGSPDAL